MKIFVDVGEAAERLEDLVDLAFRGDDVFVCRGERPVARLTVFSQGDGLPANEVAADIAEAAGSGKRTQAGGFCSIDEVWTRPLTVRRARTKI
ncbi:hypothetical protein [Mycoplana dimorpha]|uniref:hypothetical protein n=1 Tax=Mycoplana dimorpha TaxID=28320 RepID=UPI001FE1BB59|nr:hypothetical protein [Mycoplana dimorpha]